MTDPAFGQKGISSFNGKHAVHAFQVKQQLGRARTMLPVKIVAVHGGGTAGPPTVDVLPLVNQIDGVGKKTEHAIVYGIPCPRQGNAAFQIIADPKVGDIGHMVIADRDISTVKSTLDKANPGSFRRGSLSDGIYHGGIMGAKGSPSQYVMMSDSGVKIIDKNGNIIEMAAGMITITGNTTIKGNLVVTGEATITAAQTVFSTHVHSGISPGGANTDVPVPGS